MKLFLPSAAALTAALLGGCTTYTTPGYSSYGTRVYSDGYDSGGYYSRAYRDDGGYYDRGHYYGGYDERGYAYRQHNRQAEHRAERWSLINATGRLATNQLATGLAPQ